VIGHRDRQSLQVFFVARVHDVYVKRGARQSVHNPGAAPDENELDAMLGEERQNVSKFASSL
jgi:hypothetical protein